MLTLIPRMHLADHPRRYLTRDNELSAGETLASWSRRPKLEAAPRRETPARAQKGSARWEREGKLPVQISNNNEPPPDERFLFHPSQEPRNQARRFLSRQRFCRNYYVTIAVSAVARLSRGDSRTRSTCILSSRLPLLFLSGAHLLPRKKRFCPSLPWWFKNTRLFWSSVRSRLFCKNSSRFNCYRLIFSSAGITFKLHYLKSSSLKKE